MSHVGPLRLVGVSVDPVAERVLVEGVVLVAAFLEFVVSALGRPVQVIVFPNVLCCQIVFDLRSLHIKAIHVRACSPFTAAHLRLAGLRRLIVQHI